jgi:hypothetical protein
MLPPFCSCYIPFQLYPAYINQCDGFVAGEDCTNIQLNMKIRLNGNTEKYAWEEALDTLGEVWMGVTFGISLQKLKFHGLYYSQLYT